MRLDVDTSAVESVTLASLDEGWIGTANGLIGRVNSFTAPDGVASQLEFIAPSNRAAAALIRIKWGAHEFAIRLSQLALDPALDIAIRPELPLPIWKIAVEEAVNGWIRLLSEVSGTPAMLVELVRDPEVAPLNLSLTCRLSQVGRAERDVIDITASDASGWHWIASRLKQPAPSLLSTVNPVITLSFRLQAVCVPIVELRDLQLGDVVLLDETRAASNRLPLTCVSGGRILHGLDAISDGVAIHLSNKPIKELVVEHEPSVNPRPTRTSPRAGDVETPEIPQGPDALDALDMWLQFEVGRTRMSLAQIRTLTPGQVLVAAGDESTHEVRVLCDSRWIATGRLVAIGERLGVQVTDLGGANAASSDENDLHVNDVGRDGVATSAERLNLQNERLMREEPIIAPTFSDSSVAASQEPSSGTQTE